MIKEQNVQKREPKADVKFTIQLSEEQKEAKRNILTHPYNFIEGKTGSGKTLVACQVALDLFFNRRVNKIIITRPTVGTEDNGFLPGPQPLDAKVLTPTGWKMFGDLNVGDYVIGKSGKPIKVVNIFPKGVKEIFRITTTDGVSTECCIDHIWSIMTWEDNKRKNCYKTVDTAYMIKNMRNSNGKLNVYLPRNGCVEYTSNHVNVPAYSLGVLLGDGHLGNSVSFASIDDQIVQRVKLEMESIGLRISVGKNISYNISCPYKRSNKVAKSVSLIGDNHTINYDRMRDCTDALGVGSGTVYSRIKSKHKFDGYSYVYNDSDVKYTNELKNYLDNLHLLGLKSYEKFIPDMYKYNTVDVRLDVLRGLMDTDGSVKKNGEATFWTTSELLANDVSEIVRSLGGRVTINPVQKIKRLSKIGDREIIARRVSYRCAISLPDEMNPFYLDRKAVRFKTKYIHQPKVSNIESVGFKNTQCISVDSDDHLYLTDGFIVTHNTFAEKMEPWMVPIKDNMRKVYNYPEKLEKHFKSNDIELVSLSHFRGRSFENAVCIIDEYQNLTRQQLAMALGRLGKDSIMIFCGDGRQIDLLQDKNSAMVDVVKLEGNRFVYRVQLKENHRHEAVDEVLSILGK